MMRAPRHVVFLVLAGLPVATAGTTDEIKGTVSEFVFERAPFASAHASTIVETREGLAAAWFGGTREGAADVGIWVSRRLADLPRRGPEGAEAGRWTTPIEVATGVQADGTRHPCWNPVLFQMPDASLALFYKVGPSPQTWWGMVRTSRDAGHVERGVPVA